MLLEHKTAIVYGAAGPIGTAVAQAFAREGAHVFLAGRTHSTLDAAAATVAKVGTQPAIAVLDATDRQAVRKHADTVAGTTGRIDVAFNATANDDIQGIPLDRLTTDQLLQPVIKALTTQHTITTAVAPHMARTGSGAILAMAGGREAIPNLGGSHVAWTALAGLCRQEASELGVHGIRVLWLLSPGSPDAAESTGADADAPQHALIRRRPSYADIGATAAFLASDAAATMTATELNLTAGAVVD